MPENVREIVFIDKETTMKINVPFLAVINKEIWCAWRI